MCSKNERGVQPVRCGNHFQVFAEVYHIASLVLKSFREQDQGEWVEGVSGS